MKTTLSICRALLTLMMVVGTLGAEVYTLSVPDYHVNPGDTVKVPVSLDNATNLAQLRIQKVTAQLLWAYHRVISLWVLMDKKSLVGESLKV